MCSILFLQCVSTNLVLVKIRSRIYFDNFLLKFYRRLICHLTVEGYQCLIWYHKTGLLFVYWLAWFQTPFLEGHIEEFCTDWCMVFRFALRTHWIWINFCWLKLQISKTWNYSSLSFLKWHSTSIKSGGQWPIGHCLMMINIHLVRNENDASVLLWKQPWFFHM